MVEAAANGAYVRFKPAAWQACGPEHGLPTGLTAANADEDALQWALLRPQLLFLVRWPDPRQVPEAVGWGNTVRVCALLGRRQSAAFLVAQLLGMDSARCQQVLLLLWRQGCLQSTGSGPGAAPSTAGSLSDPVPTTPAGSFIVRLWRRLAGLGQD